MIRLSYFPIFICMVFVLVTGCSKKSSSELKALNPYAMATLMPGMGLGDLQLGKTTLGWFVNNIGSGVISLLIADDAAIELTFLNGQASFQFIVSGACQDETGAPGRKLDLNQDIKAFLTRYPTCTNLPLSSVSLAARQNSKANTFFKGSTDRGVRLWSPKSEAYNHGNILNNAGQLVTGEGSENLDRLEFPGGLYFYYPAGEGPTPQEMESGAPLSPERLREIEESAKEAAKNPVIKRITIFIPNK